MYTLQLMPTGAIQRKRINPAKGQRCQKLLHKGDGKHAIMKHLSTFVSEYFFIIATIKVSSFAYYTKAKFLAVLCLRAYTYIYFIFKPFHEFLLAKSIRSNDRQALEASAFQPLPRKIDVINSIKKSGSNIHTKQAFHFRVDSCDQFAFDTYKE